MAYIVGAIVFVGVIIFCIGFVKLLKKHPCETEPEPDLEMGALLEPHNQTALTAQRGGAAGLPTLLRDFNYQACTHQSHSDHLDELTTQASSPDKRQEEASPDSTVSSWRTPQRSIGLSGLLKTDGIQEPDACQPCDDTRYHMDGTLTGGYYDVQSNKDCADPAAASLYGTWTGPNLEDMDDSWASWTIPGWLVAMLLERADSKRKWQVKFLEHEARVTRANQQPPWSHSTMESFST